MKRFLALGLAAAAVTVGLAACDTYDGYDRGYAGGYYDPCTQLTTCGACTPVAGCGWCSTATGSACLSSPSECAGAPQFSWTWEPSGCATAADAGVGDAGSPEASAADSAPPDAGRPADAAAE